MKKRILSILLAVVMTFTLLPTVSFAAEIVDSGTCGDNLTWTLDSDGLLTISGTGAINSHSFFYNKSIEMVLIEEGVTSIDSYAFYDCSSLTSVSIPDSVTSIGSFAFSNCSSLTSVTIPDSVASIGYGAFYGGGSLTDLTIGDGVTEIDMDAFTETAYYNDESNWVDGVLYIGAYLIEAKKDITTCTVLETTKLISNGAFYCCDNLTSVIIPDSVTSIGDSAFSYCSSLTSVTIGDSATTIDDWAFYCCDNLTSVTIPDSVTSIGYGAFIGCSSLTSVYFLGAAPELGDCAFQIFDDDISGFVNIPGLTLYYIEGKEGWTTPTWNGYPTATWTPKVPVDFSDVKESAWYYEAVEYAVNNGLMNGVGNNEFAPESPMTRAMLVTVLWRYAGEPVEGTNTFSDVPEGQWFTQAVAWAAHNGIVNGTSPSTFDPEGNITREQMAAILYRYCSQQGIDTSKQADLSVFPDGSKTSGYALTALSWANAEGLINGSKVGATVYLDPQGNATRAQVATILMRFIENIAN